MSTLQSLITNNILSEVNDPNQVTYLSQELVNYLNYGNRILRRTIFELRPRLLQEPTLTGTLSGNLITFNKSIMRLIEVKLGHRQIFEVISEEHHHNEDILDDYEYGHRNEYGFIVMGFNQIKITPYPREPHNYSIEWVAGLDDNLALTDDTGLSLELEDLLVEFATVRAGIRNSADVSGETSIVQLFKSQIEETISNLGGPRRSIVRGYRGGNGGRRRYGYY